jgi:NitT/TauT family transport system ATP-binding protein
VSRIQVQDLCRSVGESETLAGEVVLRHVNLDIESGEIVVIIGPSGCGKTSLLNSIAGLEAPTSGSVLLDGEPIAQAKTRIGYIFQESTLFPWLTTLQNVAYGADLYAKRGYQVVSREDQEDLLLFLKLTKGDFNKYPHALSGGMKQRVELARALAYRPQVLLMDEPFRSLDAQSRKVAQGAVYEAWERYRPTIVFVTHSAIEAAFLGHRIVVMTAREHGRGSSIKCEIAGLDKEVSRGYTDTYRDPDFLRLREAVLRAVESEVARTTGFMGG